MVSGARGRSGSSLWLRLERKKVPLSQRSSTKWIFWMLQFYILSGYFSVRSVRVVERLDPRNVSVLMVDFSNLCCLSVAAWCSGREVTVRRWLWYA